MGLLARLRRRREPEVLVWEDDGTRQVLVVAADAARADSDVLREAGERGVDLDGPVLLRHHLLLPTPEAVDRAREVLADDGYHVRLDDEGPAAGTPLRARASRVQRLSALSASQERSRMAGLAQRLGGDVAGWDACR